MTHLLNGAYLKNRQVLPRNLDKCLNCSISNVVTGRSEAWYRARFGTVRSTVQICPPRDSFRFMLIPNKRDNLKFSVVLDHIKL